MIQDKIITPSLFVNNTQADIARKALNLSFKITDTFNYQESPERKYAVIKSLKGLYEISPDGHVRSVKLKGVDNGIKRTYSLLQLYERGKMRYWSVGLSDGLGKVKDYYVHKLVAEAWVFNDDPANKTEVHHINCNHLDNRASNLVWMTPREHRQLHARINAEIKS